MPHVRKFGPLAVREHVRNGKSTGKWMLDIPSSLTNTGKRLRRLYPSQRVAEAVARELRRKLELRRLGFVEHQRGISLPFSRAVELWRTELKVAVEASQLRAATLRTIEIRLKALSGFFSGIDVSMIDRTAIMRYQAHRMAADRRSSTVNGEVRVLRQLLGWLHEIGRLKQMPKSKSIPEDDVPRIEIPTQDQVVRLIESLPAQVRVLVWLMAETGLRPGEARNLPWCHVEIERGSILIDQFEGWKPKSRQSVRRVFPSPDLFETIRALPRKGPHVFVGRDPKKPIANIRSSLEVAAERAGLASNFRVTPKLFRKAFATWQIERNVSLSVVQRQMGHSPGSLVTDQNYIRVSDQAQRDHRLALPVERVRSVA
jgi:integrase